MSNIPPYINLLAWRAEQQNKHFRQFGLLLFNSVLLAISLIIIFHIVLAYQIRDINNSVFSLQQQINKQNLLKNEAIQIQNETNQLVPRTNVLTHLQNDSQQAAQLFNELSTITPAGVYLTNLSRQNQQVTLVGKTVSSAQIAVLMQNISQSALLNQATLNVMKYDNSTPPYQNSFVIQSQLKMSQANSSGAVK